MKKYLLTLLCLFALFPVAAFASVDALYQKEIVLSEDAPREMQQTGEALAKWLEKITGQSFTVSRRSLADIASEDAIQLWTAKEAEGIPELAGALGKLNQKNGESFVLDSAPDKPGLRIVGATALGVRHGVYSYLHELGFRWLFPGEHWQIVPKRENIRVALTRADAPVYLSRTFFGTGGFGSKLPKDPEMTIQKRWDEWSAANRFGAAFRLNGHYGEAFAAKYKDVFEAHPEYRAMINGERVPVEKMSQINYGNKEVRALYVEDRVEEVTKYVETHPETPDGPYSVSVDPADGYAHDQSPESQALGSISNRVFGLANEVAKAIQEAFPNGNFYVNLYGYNMHADPPDFPLEKNIIVQVIPYGFNNSKNLIGDDLLLAWKEKANLIGLYDYWGLPDWSQNQPTVDYLGDIPRKLKVWTDNNVRFFNAESCTGAGTSGIALYLASKKLWDPTVDWQAELHTFYDQAFGPARAPMQRMLERWASGFRLYDNELGLSFRDLEEAHRLAGNDEAVRARVEDYMTYAHYLRLLWEFQSAERDSEERSQAADALLRFVWQIRDNAMVQSFRITQLMTNVWAKGDDALRKAWDWGNPEATGWGSVPEYPTSKEISEMLASDSQTYPVLFEPVAFSRDYEDLVPLMPSSGDAEGEFLTTYRIYKGHELVFQSDRDGEVTFEIRLPANEKSTLEAVVTAKEVGEGGKTVLNTNLPLNGELHTLRIPVKKGQNYVVSINDRGANFWLKMPASLPLVFTRGILPNGWSGTKNWFYVPKGVKRFAIYIHANPVAEATTVAVEDDMPVEPLLSKGGITVYDVPEGEDGKAWTVSKFNTSLPVQLINVPNYLAFSRETLMVPKGIVEGHGSK